MSAKSIFPGWKVVVGSGVGVAFGSAVFIGTSFSLVAAAIGAQFGWAQADLVKGASIVLVLQMVSYPVVGWLLDRFGSRRVAMGSIAMFAMSLLLLSGIGNALWQYYLAYFLVGLLASGTNVVSYARAITLWFNRRRGLALGIAAGFQAIGSFLTPLVIQKIIASSGWPLALSSLALFEVIVCLPIVGLLVRDDPKPYGLYPDGNPADHAAAVDDVGPAAHQIMRTGTFWQLAGAFAIMGMSFYALVANVAFILTKSAALTLEQIAAVQAITGAAVLFGRVGFGYLLDRFSAQFVGLTALVLSAIFYAGYGMATSFGAVLIAAVIGGVSVGGEGDLMPYFAGRYFGKPTVSKIFGWFLSAFVLGAAVGPVAFAAASQAFGGPSVPLFALSALQIVPAILILFLGPYPSGFSERS